MDNKEIQWRGTTSIVQRLFPSAFDSIPNYILEGARQRGLALHDALESFFETGDYELEFEYQNLMNMFEEFYEKYQPEMLESELEVRDESIAVRGRLDNIMRMKDGRVLLTDFKFTYDLNLPYVEIQLSIYKMLVESMELDYKIDGIAVLHINKDGWEFHELDYRPDIVEALLTLDTYLQEKGKKRKWQTYITT